MPTTIVITRPEQQANRFANDLVQAYGGPLQTLVAPLMRIIPVATSLPELTPAHIIFTSANAVAQVERLGLSRTALAWCVGQQTADAARRLGFSVEVGHGDSKDLIAQILQARPSGRCLHLRGAHATGHVAEILTANGLNCTEAVVYAQVPQPPNDAVIAAFDQLDSLVVPLFSPRSARLLSEAVQIRGNVTAIAISPAVAKVALSWPVKAVITANSPDKSGMITATLGAYDAANGPNTP